jgi:hypothetical protein
MKNYTPTVLLKYINNKVSKNGYKKFDRYIIIPTFHTFIMIKIWGWALWTNPILQTHTVPILGKYNALQQYKDNL